VLLAVAYLGQWVFKLCLSLRAGAFLLAAEEVALGGVLSVLSGLSIFLVALIVLMFWKVLWCVVVI